MNNYSKDLLQFLDASPVNFLAVKETAKRLEAKGYKRINAEDRITDVKAGDKFYVTKNDSSIYAFHIGRKSLGEGGFHIICAHSDSPTFRIKPNAEMTCERGITKLNTEVYGGAILSTWFDRPLSIAGRVIVRSNDVMNPDTKLICIKRPILIIPNLAIHFNRQVNDGVALSKQKDMLPILGIVNSELERGNLLINLITEELGIKSTDILDFDLYLYDTTPACHVGAHNEFISAGRIDDLSMVHAGLSVLLADTENIPETTKVLGIFDNEETGSQTKQGAGSPFLSTILKRIALAQSGTEEALTEGRAFSRSAESMQASLCSRSIEAFYQAVERAFMISADNAHAWHPNYNEKYDPTNHPVLGGGPVIKFNAAQKYA
ncbi:MAG: M18 family aminopeptidase, partial [Prevotella sp.]|nr:M18 family aminopeptidase [Prevotella sp.]